MQSLSKLAGVAVVVVLASLGGCTRGFTAKRPYAAPSANDLVALLDARAAAVKSINARARATSWLSNERVRATVLMLVTRDGHLRFEAEVSLQGTVATLATDGQTFGLLDIQKNELSRGPACPANVASLVRIPLAPPEIAAILLGDVYRPADTKVSPEVGWDGVRAADVLELTTPAATLHVFFARHGADLDVTGVEALSGGRRLWLTSYEDPATVGTTRLPGRIRFSQGMDTFDDGVDIKFKDRTLNETPAAGSFVLTPPPGAVIRDVGCGV
jgi:hypothetical protein